MMPDSDSRQSHDEASSLQFMTLEIVKNVLGYTENPRELGAYLTQELREFTGAKAVILMSWDEQAEPAGRLLSFCPERRDSMIAHAGFALLVARVAEAPSELELGVQCGDLERDLLARYELEINLGAPLREGGSTLGALLLLGLPEIRSARAVTQTLTPLYSLLALVLRRTMLSERQEETIRQRTLELERSESRFRSVFENAGTGILLVDSQGTIREANPAVTMWLGWRESELRGRPFLDCLHPDDRTKAWRSFQGVLKGSSRRWAELRCRGQAGLEFWGRTTITRLGAGDTADVLCVVMIEDITEQKEAEAALRQSQARMELAFEAANEGLFDWDCVSGHLYLSPRANTMLGYEPEALCGSMDGWLAIVHPEDRDRLRKGIQGHLTQGNPMHMSEYRVRKRSGEYCWIASNAKVVGWNGDGSPNRVIGTLTDITQRKALEGQLTQAHKMEAIGRLAGGVAHDFNNLLTVINGYSDILLSRLDPGDPSHTSLTEIRKAGTRAAELTRQLLAFGRKQVIDPKPLDLNQLVAGNREMLRRLIGEDVELVTQLSPGLGMVLADGGQVHQVLMNLVVNARDAMPQGGLLTIETSNARLTEDFAKSYPGASSGDYVLLAVADTGVGMDEATRQRIFEPFFTTKDEGSGTGLGLAMAYGIVEQCGGWIDVASAPDQGARFTIGLPRIEGSALPEAVPPPLGSLRGSETVLVVEDQDEVRQLALLVLRSHGYRVLEARNGEQALLIAERRTEPLHLILTDVVMPGMTGKVLAGRLRRVRPDLKILFMSGYAEDVIAHRGVMEAGVDYIAKPFAPEELAGKVRSVLGAPRSRVRILVVDDSEEIRGLFDSILADAGYEVFQAADGDQALRVVERQTLDVVITDLFMPNRTGAETIPAIRSARPELKIIAVSGALGDDPLSGVDLSLMKPVGPKQLLDAVERVLRATAAAPDPS